MLELQVLYKLHIMETSGQRLDGQRFDGSSDIDPGGAHEVKNTIFASFFTITRFSEYS